MHPIIKKTFGGLSREYYFRQLLFSVALAILIIIPITQRESIPILAILFVIASTLLYPYSRFVYEGIVNVIMGDNVFFVNAIALLMVKYLTMALCWVFAIAIAPIGLIYLYFHHSRKDKV